MPKGQQKQPTTEEVEERKALMQTRGRKGVHLPRINMAFTPENHDYIKTIAILTGRTMTEFVNEIIDRQKDTDTRYEMAIKMREMGDI